MIFIGVLEYNFLSHQMHKSGYFHFFSCMNNYEYWHEYFPSDTVPNTMGRRDTTVYSVYNDPKILDEKR